MKNFLLAAFLVVVVNGDRRDLARALTPPAEYRKNSNHGNGIVSAASGKVPNLKRSALAYNQGTDFSYNSPQGLVGDQFLQNLQQPQNDINGHSHNLPQNSYNAPAQQAPQRNNKNNLDSYRHQELEESVEEYDSGEKQNGYGDPDKVKLTYDSPGVQNAYGAPEQSQNQLVSPIKMLSGFVPSYGPPTKTPQQDYRSFDTVNTHSDGSKIFKHVSVHVAPQLDAGEHRAPRIIQAPGNPEKHYNIIFVKAPDSLAQEETEVHLPPAPQQKTVVYLLAKNQPSKPKVHIATPAPTKPAAPEVYFVRYKDEPKNKEQTQYEAPPVQNYENPQVQNYENPPVQNYENPQVQNYVTPQSQNYETPQAQNYETPQVQNYENPGIQKLYFPMQSTTPTALGSLPFPPLDNYGIPSPSPEPYGAPYLSPATSYSEQANTYLTFAPPTFAPAPTFTTLLSTIPNPTLGPFGTPVPNYRLEQIQNANSIHQNNNNQFSQNNHHNNNNNFQNSNFFDPNRQQQMQFRHQIHLHNPQNLVMNNGNHFSPSVRDFNTRPPQQLQQLQQLQHFNNNRPVDQQREYQVPQPPPQNTEYQVGQAPVLEQYRISIPNKQTTEQTTRGYTTTSVTTTKANNDVTEEEPLPLVFEATRTSRLNRPDNFDHKKRPAGRRRKVKRGRGRKRMRKVRKSKRSQNE